jgi:hypothetical protein
LERGKKVLIEEGKKDFSSVFALRVHPTAHGWESESTSFAAHKHVIILMPRKQTVEKT